MSQLATQPKAELRFGESGFQITDIESAYRFGECMLRAGFAPKGFDKPEQVIIALQYGAELGMKPMQSMQSIAVINGRPCLYGDGLLALIQRQPDCRGVDETIGGEGDARLASCLVAREGRADVIRHFSVADAKRAGLWGKAGPWTQYPDRMLQMRARSWAIRDSYADVLRGFDVAEAVEDIPVKPVVSRATAIQEAAARTLAASGGGQEQPATERSEVPEAPSAALISDGQVKFLHTARTKAGKVSKEQLDEWLFDRGIKSSKEIPVTMFEAALAFCEGGAA